MLSQESNSYYEGEWERDQRHGLGKMFHPDGSIYEGEWLNDKENGSGILYMANGDVYQGMWKDGKKHGDGKYHFKNRGQMLKEKAHKSFMTFKKIVNVRFKI